MFKVFKGRLNSSDPSIKEYLEVFSENDLTSPGHAGCLDLLTSASNHPERIHRKIDLSWVHLGPASLDTLATDDIYPLVLKQNRLSVGERGEIISFRNTRDLFKFQELVTGYYVVHDLPEVNITFQYSRDAQKKWMFWEGKQVTEEGRVQLWSSNNRPPQNSGPSTASFHLGSSSSMGSEIRDSSSSTITTPRSMSVVSIPKIPSKPPRLPRPSFSSEVSELSQTDAAPSPSLVGAVQYAESVSSMTTGSRLSRASSTRTATNASLGTISSRTITTRPSSVMTGVGSTTVTNIDGNGRRGAIIQAPTDPPCLTLFLAEMLVIIDVTDDIKIDPELCDCQDEDLDRARSCRRVVLKCTRTKDIPAGRTVLSKSGWNLAAAGRFQREQKGSLEKVDKLRQVTLDFRCVNDRLHFVKYFGDLKDLYLVNLQRGG